MKTLFWAALAVFALMVSAEAAERRIALVVGNANYQTGSLPTPANDAGLVAQTLQAAGFDVTGARDLDQESLRRAFRDFLDKSSSSGPDTVAYIYLSGYGVQLEGENYFVPVDARIASDASVSAEALRLSDYLRPLSALHLKTVVVVLDLARANPFARSGNPLTGGLALVEAEPGTLIAFNAAPGTVAPDESGPYSAYAQALAEISREGGVSLDDAFARIRLRVNQITNGGQVPWHSSKLQAPIYLFERAPNAPPPQVTAAETASIRRRPIRDFDAREAYLAALDRDTLEAYEDFLATYPNDPMARRVRAIVAARREAITWRRTRSTDTPQAYWSYLRRYPRGAHSYDARRRLSYLSAALEPPPSFTVIEYDLPPPPPDEIVYVDRPVLAFADPEFDFAPPPPPPVVFLPPPPVYFVDLPPPPPPAVAFVLPIPEYRPVPMWVEPPPQIVPPPSNIIYNNIHNTVVINNTTNLVTITNPQGQAETVTPAVAAAAPLRSPAPGLPAPSAAPPSLSPAGMAAVGAAGAAAVLAPTLPPSVATRAPVTPNPQPVPPAKPLAPGGIIRTQQVAPPPAPPTGPAPAAVGTPSPVPAVPPPAGARPGAAATSPTPPSPAQGTPASPPAPAAPAGAATPSQQGKQVGQPLPGAAGGQPLPQTTRPTGSPTPGATAPGGTKAAPGPSPSPTGNVPPQPPSTGTPKQAQPPSPGVSPGPSPSPQPQAPTARPEPPSSSKLPGVPTPLPTTPTPIAPAARPAPPPPPPPPAAKP
ncbi:caspase family protein, partial [Bradyrhizobium erythrophlei]|uniref:caspase family protein n=1 Tax=Bradyrhizobium erythrophlei TaxID=1437360 RepID=UPI0035EAA244